MHNERKTNGENFMEYQAASFGRYRVLQNGSIEVIADITSRFEHPRWENMWYLSETKRICRELEELGIISECESFEIVDRNQFKIFWKKDRIAWGYIDEGETSYRLRFTGLVDIPAND